MPVTFEPGDGAVKALGRVDNLAGGHRSRIMMEATWTKARKFRAVFS